MGNEMENGKIFRDSLRSCCQWGNVTWIALSFEISGTSSKSLIDRRFLEKQFSSFRKLLNRFFGNVKKRLKFLKKRWNFCRLQTSTAHKAHNMIESSENDNSDVAVTNHLIEWVERAEDSFFSWKFCWGTRRCVQARFRHSLKHRRWRWIALRMIPLEAIIWFLVITREFKLQFKEWFTNLVVSLEESLLSRRRFTLLTHRLLLLFLSHFPS